MYISKKQDRTSLIVNEGYIGETLEKKIQRMVNNKEPLKDGAPLVYTERKQGVLPGYDIRTDRFDVALDGMDKVAKTEIAKREDRHKAQVIEMKKDDGKPDSTQA